MTITSKDVVFSSFSTVKKEANITVKIVGNYCIIKLSNVTYRLLLLVS